jgi:hypothetical protein
LHETKYGKLYLRGEPLEVLGEIQFSDHADERLAIKGAATKLAAVRQDRLSY